MQTSATPISRFSEPQRTPTSQPRLKSQDLFRGTNELVIEHQGQEYRLRLTRNHKLILNK